MRKVTIILTAVIATAALLAAPVTAGAAMGRESLAAPSPIPTEAPNASASEASPEAEHTSAVPPTAPVVPALPVYTEHHELVSMTSDIVISGAGDERYLIASTDISLEGLDKESLLMQIQSQNDVTIQVVDCNGQPVDGDQPIGTGMVVEMLGSDGEVIDYAAIVIPGDVMGTGKINLTQLMRMALAYAGIKPLDGPFLSAGDFTGNGEIDFTDLVREMQTFLAIQSLATES